jgi:hypothetical protein
MILEVVYRCQQGTVDICECTEAIGTFTFWLGLDHRAPPRQEDNNGVDPRGSPKLNTRARRDLGPPFQDLMTEGVGRNTVVLPVIMPILVE